MIGFPQSAGSGRLTQSKQLRSELLMLSRKIWITGLMAFSLFGARLQANNEVAFWNWFIANEPRLFVFESDQDSIFNALTQQLNGVNADLTFEFGPVTNGGVRHQCRRDQGRLPGGLCSVR